MKNQKKDNIVPFKKKKRKEIRIVKVSRILKRRAEKMEKNYLNSAVGILDHMIFSKYRSKA